jgi:YfiR/HmsC-like
MKSHEPQIKTGSTGRFASGLLLGWLCLVLGVFGPVGFTAPAAETAPLEHKVKAACLFNFVANTEWPEQAFTGPDEPIVIGLIGDVPFGPLLDRGLQGKTIGGRKLVVRGVTVAESAQCQLVFIASSATDQLQSLVTAVAGKPVLLVGEAEGFAKRGGMINFVKVEGSVKFEINLAAAERSGLKLGSQMLKLAIMIQSAHLQGNPDASITPRLAEANRSNSRGVKQQSRLRLVGISPGSMAVGKGDFGTSRPRSATASNGKGQG